MIAGKLPVRYLEDDLVRRFLDRQPERLDAVPLGAAVDEPAVVIASATETGLVRARAAKRMRHGVVIVAVYDGAPSGAGMTDDPVHTYVPLDAPPAVAARMIASAAEHATIQLACADAESDAQRLTRELRELNDIGIRLSSEHDLDELLTLILGRAREITRSDAGSLYLIEHDESGNRRLRFKLIQNDTVPVSLDEFTLPITSASVAGHVALTGQTIRLTDAYAPPPDATFRINRDFDARVGYRTKSMLVVPMKTTKNETIGVVQLINHKRQFSDRFVSAEDIERRALSYSADAEALAASLASQAAVAVDSARLYQSIQALFDGFVRASVVAIEARDPTTSGHSFRVADLTVALAEVVDRVDHGPYAGIRFSADQLRELRYASLLHDFGKVGVPDQVLVKAKKLLPGRLELIRERVDRFKAGLALKTARHKIGWLLAHGAADFERESGRLDAEFSTMLDTLDRYLEVAVTANEPSVLPAPVAELLAEMTSTRFEDHQGVSGTVITPDEAGILSIPLGSLTDEERRQIQGHVVHTFQFLSQIPWTSDLRRVPEIARSHHEKLNGSGYPYGIKGDDIPIQSRMMSVADIYDALTAADRPYKRAMSVERALDILVAETKAGAIEGGLLDLFIDSQVFKCIGPSR